jgi:hypothetical protein
MTPKRLTWLALAAVLLVGLAFASQSASAATFYDKRDIIVRPSSGPERWRDCSTCYRGHDFGSDCFQNVWTGFEQFRANVCLWGWN